MSDTFFDETTKNLFNRLEKELSGYEISISASDKAEEKFIVRTYSDRSLGGYYLYDLKKDQLTKIQEVSPWIDENHMAEIKPIQYRSRDGLIIHGYLTLPKGVEPKNLPVVVNPHGGPWARDNWGFNPEVQFFGKSWVCCAADELPRFNRIWKSVLGSQFQTMGSQYAG